MDAGLHPEQVKALRKMTPTRRLELSLGFIEQMRELRAAMLRLDHPDWTGEQIAAALRGFVRDGGS